jgi:hypothetical protein
VVVAVVVILLKMVVLVLLILSPGVTEAVAVVDREVCEVQVVVLAMEVEEVED